MTETMMKVTIYGAGYVGLVTGVCLSDLGHDVLIVDVDSNKINRLNIGTVPIYEPGLQEKLLANVQAKRLQFTTCPIKGAQHGVYQFIAVGTPSNSQGAADLQYVLNVAKGIGKHMTSHCIVINKSTVPVGTAASVRACIQAVLDERGSAVSFDMVSNPEFLKEGDAIADFMHPDRIVIGTDNQEAAAAMKALYAPLKLSQEKCMSMDLPSAELTKYASNALLATKISFINALSQIAEKTGADIEQVRQGMAADQRIGPHFIDPGCGYGGSCFPKDVSALSATAKQHGLTPVLLDAVEQVNAEQKQVLFNKIHTYYAGNLQGKILAVWGLAFKPHTDDIREASSAVLLSSLWQAGAKVQAYDPAAMAHIRAHYGERADLTLCESALAALAGADALVIVTQWPVFQAFDLDLLYSQLKNPVVFDGRNIYDPATMAEAGFTYFAIGRGARLCQQ